MPPLLPHETLRGVALFQGSKSEGVSLFSPLPLPPQVQLHTLFQQYQDLASACSDVARERDKLRGEVQLLRDELHR